MLKNGYKALLLVAPFLLSNLTGCGGGGNSNPVPTISSPAQPTKQVFLSEKVLEPIFSISSQDANLYAGTQYGLVEIDAISGTKRTIVGNQLYLDAGGGLSTQSAYPPSGLFDAATTSTFVPLHPYNEAKIANVSLSPSFSAPEIAIPQRAILGLPNFRGMTANTTQAFWMGFDGGTTMNVYTEAYGLPISHQRIASVTASDGGMATFGDYLYLYTDEPNTPTRMVFRYQISSGNLVTVEQTRSTTNYTLNFPLSAASSGVYWAEGSNIYFLDNANNTATQIGSVGGTITQLTAVGSVVYSLHWETNTSTIPTTYSIVVTQFDTSTSTSAEMVRHASSSMQAAQISSSSNGRIFLAEDVIGLGINVSEITGTNTLSQIVNLSAYGLKGIYASSSSLAISAMQSGTTIQQIYRHNLASAVTDQIVLPFSPYYMQGVGESLFLADSPGNIGIMRIELNMPLNAPVALQPSPAVNSSWSQGGTSFGGYFYWVGAQFTQTGSVYQLEKSMPNGTNFAVLLQTTGELRDPTVFNGRVYFLCKDSCGAAGWVLASTTLAGSSQQIEATVAGINPRLYQYNGHAYLTASDGLMSSIFALDMTTWAVSEMVSQLPYDTLYLDFSSKWLYWSGNIVNANGTPAREVSRQAWIDWNHVDAKQRIEWGSGAGVVDDLQVSSLHYFAGNLYYWNHGLIRVPE